MQKKELESISNPFSYEATGNFVIDMLWGNRSASDYKDYVKEYFSKACKRYKKTRALIKRKARLDIQQDSICIFAISDGKIIPLDILVNVDSLRNKTDLWFSDQIRFSKYFTSEESARYYSVDSLYEEFDSRFTSLADVRKSRKEKKERRERNSLRGYKTYVMIDKNRGYHKIGRAKSVPPREKTLQAEIPSIEVVLSLNFDIEKDLHRLFKNKRLRGEWFELSLADITFVKSLSKKNKNQIIKLIDEYRLKT